MNAFKFLIVLVCGGVVVILVVLLVDLLNAKILKDHTKEEGRYWRPLPEIVGSMSLVLFQGFVFYTWGNFSSLLTFYSNGVMGGTVLTYIIGSCFFLLPLTYSLSKKQNVYSRRVLNVFTLMAIMGFVVRVIWPGFWLDGQKRFLLEILRACKVSVDG